MTSTLWEPSLEWVRDMAENSVARNIGRETALNAIVKFVLHPGVPWEMRHYWAVRGLAEVAYDRAAAGVKP